MTPQLALLAAHLAATAAMTGLIWFVQLVHYPLFSRVGEPGFAEYEREHQRRTTWVVAPLMLAELGTSAAIAVRTPPGVSPSLAYAGLGLVVVLWLLTAFVQVPLHNALGRRYEPRLTRSLVASNWLRTGAWTARTGIALVMLGSA